MADTDNVETWPPEAVEVESVNVTVDTANEKSGGDAALTMTPALPGAGAFSTSDEISMVATSNKKDVEITVFSDQPMEIFVEESFTSGGTFDRSEILGTALAGKMKKITLRHGRDFAKVVVKNIGSGAATILRVGHKAWEF